MKSMRTTASIQNTFIIWYPAYSFYKEIPLLQIIRMGSDGRTFTRKLFTRRTYLPIHYSSPNRLPTKSVTNIIKTLRPWLYNFKI